MNRVKIPHINPELFLSKSLIFVGSSGALKGSRLGQKIDSFHEVIRYNRAPTKEFEMDVGLKTTLRVVNNHVFANVDISNKGYTKQPPNFVKDLRNSRLVYVGPDHGPLNNRAAHCHPSNDLFKFNYSFINNLKSNTSMEFASNPTIGLVTIGLAIIAGIRPTIIGFDLEPLPRTHYYESRPAAGGKVHNLTAEQTWLATMRDLNKVTVLT